LKGGEPIDPATAGIDSPERLGHPWAEDGTSEVTFFVNNQFRSHLELLCDDTLAETMFPEVGVEMSAGIDRPSQGGDNSALDCSVMYEPWIDEAQILIDVVFAGDVANVHDQCFLSG